MRKLLKTLVLIPMYPLIWLTFLEPRNGYQSQCARNADAMLRWRSKP